MGPSHYATSGFTREVLRGSSYVGARTIEDRLETASAHSATPAGGSPTATCRSSTSPPTADGWASADWTGLLERVDGAVRDAVAGPAERGDVLVTADHGMVDVPASAHVVLEGLGLLDDVRLLAGEPRLLHVHLAPGARTRRRDGPSGSAPPRTC